MTKTMSLSMQAIKGSCITIIAMLPWLPPLCRIDPFCQEAFAALVDNHMLTSDEEFALLDSLPFTSEDRWMVLLYRAKCKKVRQLTALSL